MAGSLDPALANNQHPDISCSSSPSLPDSGTSPDRPFAGADKDGLYDRKLLEDLVDEISSVRKMGTGVCDSSPLERKKRKRVLEQTVKWLRGVALNPVDPALVVREREQQILNARREMYVKIDDVADLEELPNFASLRKKKKAWHFSDERYKDKRRSERIAKSFSVKLSSHLISLHKRIGVGDLFQAQIPPCSGPHSDASLTTYKTNPNISKYLGTSTWPTESPAKKLRLKKHISDGCNCITPGSVECVKNHVDLARTRLRSELGPAFYVWDFDSMGEYMSNAFLTRQEQVLLESIERGNINMNMNVGLEGCKRFWSVADKCLKMKKRKDLVWYYFNVYLLRQVAWQSRTRPVTDIDSDEEDDVMSADDDEGGNDGDGGNDNSHAECFVSSSPNKRSEKTKRRRC